MNSISLPKKTNKKFMVLSAIGIIMVVDLHSNFALNLFNSYVPYTSFFMPMFVFISGYFNKVDDKTDLKAYVRKKIRSLLVPYIAIVFATFWLQWALNCIKFGTLQPITIDDIYLMFVVILTTGFPVAISSPLWFIPSFFLVVVGYAVLKKIFCKRWNSLIAFGIFSLLHMGVVLCSNYYGDSQLFFAFILPLKCIFFLPFIELGIIYREKMESQLSNLNKGTNILLITVLLILSIIRMKTLPQGSDIQILDIYRLTKFPSPFIFTPLLSSIIGILFWLTIVDTIGSAFYDNKVVNFISENTYFIMGFHVFFFNLVNCVLLLMNSYVIPLPGFDDYSCRVLTYYTWEEYPQFRIVYFIVGLAGAMALKLLCDKVKALYFKTRK